MMNLRCYSTVASIWLVSCMALSYGEACDLFIPPPVKTRTITYRFQADEHMLSALSTHYRNIEVAKDGHKFTLKNQTWEQITQDLRALVIATRGRVQIHRASMMRLRVSMPIWDNTRCIEGYDIIHSSKFVRQDGTTIIVRDILLPISDFLHFIEDRFSKERTYRIVGFQ